MPLTIAKSDYNTLSGGTDQGVKQIVGTYNGVASYAADGETIAASAFHSDASTVHSFIISISKDAAVRYVYDGTAVLAYNTSDEAEVTDTTDLSGAVKAGYFVAYVS